LTARRETKRMTCCCGGFADLALPVPLLSSLPLLVRTLLRKLEQARTEDAAAKEKREQERKEREAAAAAAAAKRKAEEAVRESCLHLHDDAPAAYSPLLLPAAVGPLLPIWGVSSHTRARRP